MNRTLLREFYTWLEGLQGKEHFLAAVAFRAAPAIRGYKPAILTTFSSRRKNLYRLFNLHGQEAADKFNLQPYVLQDSGQHCQVLLARPQLLAQVLADGEARLLLREFGYPANPDVEGNITYLKARMEQGFPHEIGVFLGYPPQDVRAFIEGKGENALLRRYWKVYHNPQGALKTFSRYDRSIEEAAMALMMAEVP